MDKAELGVRDKGLTPVEAWLNARSRLPDLRVYALHVLCRADEPICASRLRLQPRATR